MTGHDDPHQELHDIAAADTQHDHPVQADDNDWRAAVDKLNKALTKRINDLRTDIDTFESATSKSVGALSSDVSSAKTAIQNNKDAIEAQDGLIGEAKTAAGRAKTAADEAAQKATASMDAADALRSDYAAHTHEFSLSGKTAPVTKGGK